MKQALYKNIRDSLDTGDIVLFSGKGRISAGIKWLSNSEWSHVGMVLRVPEWDMALLWESTTLSNLEDMATGKATRGVQLVPLSERLQSYNGKVAIRPLDADNIDGKSLIDFRREVTGRPYEKSKIQLLKSTWDGGAFTDNTEDLSSLFCSELVAEAYQRMGLLGEDKPSNEYIPADFSVELPDKRLPLLRGTLQEPIYLL